MHCICRCGVFGETPEKKQIRPSAGSPCLFRPAACAEVLTQLPKRSPLVQSVTGGRKTRLANVAGVPTPTLAP